MLSNLVLSSARRSPLKLEASDNVPTTSGTEQTGDQHGDSIFKYSSLFEATEIAPGASVTSVRNQCHDVIDIGKAATEQLERLRRGKSSAA